MLHLCVTFLIAQINNFNAWHIKTTIVTPNDYACIDNYVKTCDNNEEEKNDNRHDELYDDDSDDEGEEVYHCDLRNNNNKVKTLNESDELIEKEKNENILMC